MLLRRSKRPPGRQELQLYVGYTILSIQSSYEAWIEISASKLGVSCFRALQIDFLQHWAPNSPINFSRPRSDTTSTAVIHAREVTVQTRSQLLSLG